MTYPVTARQDVVERLHGHPVPDPYRWLEDPELPQTRQWMAAQQQLWLAHSTSLPGRDAVHALVARLCGYGLRTAPVWRGQRCFSLIQTAAQEHPVLHTAGRDGASRALLDPVALDPTAATTLDHWQPDLEGRLLAFQISRRGDERSELFVLDVGTGQVVDGPVERCRYSPVAWLPGGTGFYYVRSAGDDPATRRRVFLHRVGDPPDSDIEVFGAGRHETSRYGLGMSADGRWLAISSASAARPGTDVWLADLAASAPQQPRLQVVHEGRDARSAPAVGRDGRMYLVTDLGAARGRICVGDPSDPGPENWRELVAPDPQAVLADVTILDGPRLPRPLLVVRWTRHAISEISVHDRDTGERLRTVPLPGLGAAGPLSAAPGGHEVWFTYTDWVTPTSVFRYDAAQDTTTPWPTTPWPTTPDAAPAVTSADAPRIETRHVVATSADGTPIRLVVLAGAGRAGPRPTILYGYGGFGISLVPSYSAFALGWVAAGGVFAAAHLRGGGEEGEQWHRDGALDRKQNAFDDFAAAAQALIDNGVTTPGQLGICGESNGGLLVGATVTQRPDLIAAAVCSTPLLDMVRYERSGLGPAWTGEYGSARDPEQFRWLLGYSPYHHVDAVDYPAVLFTVFNADTRVDPWHARKMCAALQRASTGNGPVLLRAEDDVGHGARAATGAVGLTADMIAFLAAHTGLDLTALAAREPR